MVMQDLSTVAVDEWADVTLAALAQTGGEHGPPTRWRNLEHGNAIH
jgi:hypothetical protein